MRAYTENKLSVDKRMKYHNDGDSLVFTFARLSEK